MNWSWAFEGITEDVPRTTGPECTNYMTNRRRWIEAVLFTVLFGLIIRGAKKNLAHIVVPPLSETERPHSPVRLMLIIAMTFTFGIEMGFKFASKSVIFALNPCHIQTIIQIYLLAAKPSKTTIALFRIQMNNLNGPFLAFLFPEVDSRTMPFEQATYWVQHALLYIIPVYILKTDAYQMEDFYDYNWTAIGVAIMLTYHFVILNALSIFTGINLSHMLCAAVSDPFQGQNYRIAAVIHQAILCPILNKSTVYIFSSGTNYTLKQQSAQEAVVESNQTEKTIYHQLKQQQRAMIITTTSKTTSTKEVATSKPASTELSGTNNNTDSFLTRRLVQRPYINHYGVNETAPGVKTPIAVTSNCSHSTKSDLKKC